MQDVADDRHRQIGKIFFVVADGVHIEQALRWVRMTAITGVDNMDVIAAGRGKVLRDQMRRTARGMTHDEHVGLHRGEIIDGVEQGLALGSR